MSDQILNVNDIANDKSALERRVKDKTGKTVKLDEHIAIIKDLQSVTSFEAPALLLKEHGDPGAVYIHEESAEPVGRVLTGPEQSKNYQILFLKDGQNFRFYGRPTVWFFRVCE
jgi:hypothetical protein